MNWKEKDEGWLVVHSLDAYYFEVPRFSYTGSGQMQRPSDTPLTKCFPCTLTSVSDADC